MSKPNLSDTIEMAVEHPHYPLYLTLPSYIPNDISLVILLSSFAALFLAITWTTSIVARVIRPSISKSERYMAMWFILCGCIHLFFEGYFSVHNAHMPGRTHYFGQLWKEYAKSDSRYLTRDSFVFCMETVTAFLWGPLSFLIGYMIIKDNHFRHSLQIIVSVGQVYGDVLYYATFFYDGAVHGATYCRPEAWYFWLYFIMMNGFWMVIPSWVIVDSVVKIAGAFEEKSQLELGEKTPVKKLEL